MTHWMLQWWPASSCHSVLGTYIIQPIEQEADRRSAAFLPFISVPVVTPDVAQAEPWRKQSSGNYGPT